MKKDSIIIHHSATRDSGTVSWGAIRRYHKEVCGWRDIGYNYGIELVGGHDYEILVGRFCHEAGAHTKGWNQRSIGICLVGDFDETLPPRKQLNAAIELVQHLMSVYDIKVHNVLGHRETLMPHAKKSCPGVNFDMDRFRGAVR